MITNTKRLANLDHKDWKLTWKRKLLLIFVVVLNAMIYFRGYHIYELLDKNLESECHIYQSYETTECDINLIHKPILNCTKDILLVIKTRPESLSRRERLREIYADEDVCGPYFVIGQNDVPVNLSAEIELFGDLVVAKFPDRYDTLPTKTLASLQYALSISNWKYMIAHDDDFVFKIKSFKPSYFNIEDGFGILCTTVIGYEKHPMRWGKNRMSINAWPIGCKLPKFCGGANVFTRRAASVMEEYAKYQLQSITTDDVWFTGVARVRAQISDRTLTSRPNLRYALS